MAARFPLYTDADVRGPLIKALKKAGWGIVRAIDVLPEGADDLPHFERAAALGRVLVTNDEDQEAIVILAEGRQTRTGTRVVRTDACQAQWPGRLFPWWKPVP